MKKNLVDVVKSFPTRIYVEKSALIQPRRNPLISSQSLELIQFVFIRLLEFHHFPLLLGTSGNFCLVVGLEDEEVIFLWSVVSKLRGPSSDDLTRFLLDHQIRDP